MGASVNMGLAKRSKTKAQAPLKDSCKKFKLTGSNLQAQCMTKTQSWLNTSVNLSNCVVNNRGQLERGGAYDRSCNSCTFSGTTLTCKCRKINGEYKTSNVDLNKFMTNSNGKFKNCGTATTFPIADTAGSLGSSSASGSSSSSTVNPNVPGPNDIVKQNMERNTNTKKFGKSRKARKN